MPVVVTTAWPRVTFSRRFSPVVPWRARKVPKSKSCCPCIAISTTCSRVGVVRRAATAATFRSPGASPSYGPSSGACWNPRYAPDHREDQIGHRATVPPSTQTRAVAGSTGSAPSAVEPISVAEPSRRERIHAGRFAISPVALRCYPPARILVASCVRSCPGTPARVLERRLSPCASARH